MCPDKLLSEKNKSGREILRRNLSRGEQTFESKKEMWPVQEPIPKLEALYQVLKTYIKIYLNILNINGSILI